MCRFVCKTFATNSTPHAPSPAAWTRLTTPSTRVLPPYSTFRVSTTAPTATKRATTAYRRDSYLAAKRQVPSAAVAYTSFQPPNVQEPCIPTISPHRTTSRAAGGATSPTSTSPMPTTIPGASGSLYGQDSTISANLRPTTPMHGRATRASSASSTWLPFPRTAITSTAHSGTAQAIPCTCSRTGHGPAAKGR